MLEVIRKLLTLQERDLQILSFREELRHIPAERQQLQAKTAATQSQLLDLRNRLKHLESERKRLELEAQGKKELIEKYSLQQFQTKKNEEYKALAKEIENCRKSILKLEDEQLDLMEQGEALQKRTDLLAQEATQADRNLQSVLAALTQREQELQHELQQGETTRHDLAQAVDASLLQRYERLLRQRGRNVIVGIQHGVCGGCHMRLSRQTLVSCQAEQEIITCSNCSRILYYTPDMDLATAE